jgi:hypothetical protein
MDDLTKYEWWEQDGGPPPHLKTKTQKTMQRERISSACC